MSVFEYKALTPKGKKQSGIVDADSRAAAREKLRRKSLFPISMTRIQSDLVPGKKKQIRHRIPGLGSRVKSKDIVMVTRLLSTLISAGFPLVKAVESVAFQTASQALHRILSHIKDAIEEGSSFAQALAFHPNVFSSVYINMVAAGESSGTLEIVLERLADFAEKSQETRKKIMAALAYPIIMALIGFLVLIILMTYIVPGIVGIFSDMNQALPLPTLILISISDFFINFWWAVLALPLVVTALICTIRTRPKGVLITDRIILNLPVAGSLVSKLSAARFSRTLSSLLGNGVPMLTALNITRNVVGNKVIANVIESAADKVEKGGELNRSLAKTKYFPHLVSQMIQVGEKSGEMEKMLEKSAEIYEKEVETAVTAATALIEPLIILFMGVIVGLIIMAVCLPIVEINQLVV